MPNWLVPCISSVYDSWPRNVDDSSCTSAARSGTDCVVRFFKPSSNSTSPESPAVKVGQTHS
jgi:hypothetical protein